MSRGAWLVGAALLAAVVAAACSSGSDGNDGEARSTADSTADPGAAAADSDEPAERRFVSVSAVLRGNFPNTDFSITSIDLEELRDGGVAKDGIPAIDDPKYISQEAADRFLHADEPVVALEVNGEARAYPLQILMWHEIANDTLGEVPVAVTFCPLCNTAIVFDARVDGEARSFGVSGLLRRSDLVMYDRTNESLWQQITGEAIAGVDTGTRLTFIPSQIVSWQDFQQSFPDALVLSRDTGSARPYGHNPYLGYDRIGSSTLFPVREFDDERLDAKERVLTVELDGETVAFPFSELSEHVVMETEVGGAPLVAFWQPGALSALDETIIVVSRNVGAAGAFAPFLDGERLRFEARGAEIVDIGTGSVWNVLGRAISGPLVGASLEPVLSANHFWFSWVVFQPETRVIRGDSVGR